MPEKGKKNLNSNVEETILKDFDRHNKIRGYTKYRALEGAMRLWLQASPEQQVKVMNGQSITRPVTDRVHRIGELLEEFRRLTIDYCFGMICWYRILSSMVCDSSSPIASQVLDLLASESLN